MFPGELVAAVNDSFEPKFGMASLVDAKCIISPDTPEDIQNYLSAATFQSMASGEVTNLPIKYKVAKSMQWPVPSIWASNMPGRWKDKCGAIQRRIWYLLFGKLVLNRDTSLKVRIIEQELATLFTRCILKYFEKIEEVGSDDVWKHAPDNVLETKDNLSVFTNPLEDFLENGSNVYQIVFSPGVITPMSRLQQAYANFMEFGVHKRKGACIGRDHYPLTKRGYKVVTQHLCKICGTKVSIKNCGDHYDRRNRTRRCVVENLEIIHTRDNEPEANGSEFIVDVN